MFSKPFCLLVGRSVRLSIVPSGPLSELVDAGVLVSDSSLLLSPEPQRDA